MLPAVPVSRNCPPQSKWSHAIRADYVTVNSTYVSLYGGNGYESGGMEAVSGKLYFTKKVYEETALIVAGEDDNG